MFSNYVFRVNAATYFTRTHVMERFKTKWKEEPVGKRYNYTRGSYTGYSRYNNNGKRGEIILESES